MYKRTILILITSASLTQAMQQVKVARPLPTPPGLKQVMIADNDETDVPRFHKAIRQGNAENIQTFLKQPNALRAVDSNGYTSLHVAAQYGLIEVVRILLSANAPKDAKSKEGETPLYSAVLAENEEIVSLLLSRGVDINICTANGWSPLHLAAATGCSPLVRMLLLAQAKVNVSDKRGQTPMHLSVIGGHLEATHLLLEAKATIDSETLQGETPIQIALRIFYVPMVKLLLRKGATNKEESQTICDGFVPLARAVNVSGTVLIKLLTLAGANADIFFYKEQETPMHWAAGRGLADIVQVLLIAFAAQYGEGSPSFFKAINVRNGQGKTPLRLAAEQDYREVVKLLLTAGANNKIGASIDDNLWLKLLQKAMDAKDAIFVESLAKSGANITMLDTLGNTAWHMAASKGCNEIITVLFRFVANLLKKPNKDGLIPIRLAVLHGHFSTVKLILSLSESNDLKSVNVVNDKGQSILIASIIARELGCMEMFMQLDAPESVAGQPLMKIFDFPDKEGRTPLHWAIQVDFLLGIRKLLEDGAQRNSPDSNGDIPLHMAVQKGSCVYVEHLLSYALPQKKHLPIGADVQNKFELTPLALAMKRSDQATAVLLVEKGGANLAASTIQGRTSLEYLLTKDCMSDLCNCHKIYTLLMQRGARVNSPRTVMFPYQSQGEKHLFLRTLFNLQFLGERHFPGAKTAKKT